MTHYDLYLKDNNHPIFSGFTSALMRTYSLADDINKAILAKAFPVYFVLHVDPKAL